MSKAKEKLTDADYEHLGRSIATVFEAGYINKSRIMRMSILRGIFQGFGAVLGGTILVALLVWILSLFGHIPLVGNFAEKLQNTVNSTQN